MSEEYVYFLLSFSQDKRAYDNSKLMGILSFAPQVE